VARALRGPALAADVFPACMHARGNWYIP